MFDARPPAAMPPPRSIAAHAPSVKTRRHELSDPAVAAVGEDAAMPAAEPLDIRHSVVKRIVAIAGPTAVDRSDAEAPTLDDELQIA